MPFGGQYTYSLASERRDPRAEIAQQTAEDITPEGPIAAFSQGTEKSIIRVDDASERQKMREALREYCIPDTLAMVMIWQEFGSIAEMSCLSP